MSLLWPTVLKDDLGALGRFGRVCHWALLVLGALAGWAFTMSSGGWATYWPIFVAFFVTGALGGRALRYIFAGE